MSKYFNDPAVYFIMGTDNTGKRQPLEVLKEALQGGIDYFQLREKGPSALTGSALIEFAVACQQLCREYDVPFIVNDDVELAWEIGADGVHIGQEDQSALHVRRIIGLDKILGVSVHSLEEAAIAMENGADYVGMGPVFETCTKTDAKKPAGVNGIEMVKNKFPNFPVVGIGGITPLNAELVWAAGADGIAVISAIADAKNLASQITLLRPAAKAGAVK